MTPPPVTDVPGSSQMERGLLSGAVSLFSPPLPLLLLLLLLLLRPLLPLGSSPPPPPPPARGSAVHWEPPPPSSTPAEDGGMERALESVGGPGTAADVVVEDDDTEFTGQAEDSYRESNGNLPPTR